MSRTLWQPVHRFLAVPRLAASARAQGNPAASLPCTGMELRLDDTTSGVVSPARVETAGRDTTARAGRASAPLAGRPPAIRLLASVSAREVRFAARPIIRI